MGTQSYKRDPRVLKCFFWGNLASKSNGVLTKYSTLEVPENKGI